MAEMWFIRQENVLIIFGDVCMLYDCDCAHCAGAAVVAAAAAYYLYYREMKEKYNKSRY